MFSAGINPFDPQTPVMKELLERRPSDGIRTKLAMIECYDVQYKVYDHTHPDASPMGIFLMHPAEDPLTDSPRELLIRDILHKRLPDMLNMGIYDILNLPRSDLEFYLNALPSAKDSNNPNAMKAEAMAEVEKQIALANKKLS